MGVDDRSRMIRITRPLPAGFSPEWARNVLVRHHSRLDPDWLLGSVLKVLEVKAEENPHPGMLSDSYMLAVSYTEGDKTLKEVSWFVKIPKSVSTAPMDEVEAFAYTKLLPKIQDFAERRLGSGGAAKLPIPQYFYCYYTANERKWEFNAVVTEDLRDLGFRPLRPDLCGVVYMRGQMSSLARFHASAFAYVEDCAGGRQRFLKRNEKIKDKRMPRMSILRSVIADRLLAYLTCLQEVLPAISNQLGIFIKFERHLFGIFKKVHRTPGLDALRTIIHGDSKMDNFLFRRGVNQDGEEEYEAVIIDWQGVCYDLLSSDVMWALYGLLKNLPDKSTQVDTFFDYSVAFYHQQLIKHLRALKVKPENLNLPTDEYDAIRLMKTGFVYEFLRVTLIRPAATGLRDPDALLDWFNRKKLDPTVETPKVEDIFNGGQGYVSFIYLYFKIATEVGVFQELAPMCFAALRESVFGGGSFDKTEDDDDEAEEYEDDCYGLSKKDLAAKGIAQDDRKSVVEEASKILGNENNNDNDSGRQTMSTSFESLNNEDKNQAEKTSNDEVAKVADASSEPKLDNGATSSNSQNGTVIAKETPVSTPSKSGSHNSSRRGSNGNSRLEDLASRRRHMMRRTSSTLSQPLPDVHDSDDDDYEYHEGNKSVVNHTVYLRTPSRDLAV